MQPAYQDGDARRAVMDADGPRPEGIAEPARHPSDLPAGTRDAALRAPMREESRALPGLA